MLSIYKEWNPKVVVLFTGHRLFKAYFRRLPLKEVKMASAVPKRSEIRKALRRNQE